MNWELIGSMKTSKKKLLIVGVLLIVVFAVIVAVLSNHGEDNLINSPAVSEETSPKPFEASPQKENVTTAEAKISQEAEEAIESLDIPEDHKKGLRLLTSIYSNPFDFYGKVVDEEGNPIADARVGFSLLQGHFASGKKGSTASDQEGLFSIKGEAGALTVGVSKSGYYAVPQYSAAAFSTTMQATPELLKRTKPPYQGGYDKPLPIKNDPAIFVLRKKGEAEDLIRLGSRQIDVPKTGEIVSIDLSTGKLARGGGDLQVMSWVDDQGRTENYNWRYLFKVPGGGLAERSGEFEFKAPANQYSESIEIKMDSKSDDWKSRYENEFFAKLGDGTYARFNVRLYPGRRNFIVIESYLNPSGSRNLEYDPSLAIKP